MTFKRILSGFLATLLIASAVPTPAFADTPKESPVAAYIDESAINPEYQEWVENGQQGLAPSTQDFSYLAESYANLVGSAATATNRGALPSSYDLRDYGRVDPVVDQGDLGVCWAIAAASAASGSISDQFPQLSLSAMHTAWFCYHGSEEEEFAPLVKPYLAGGNDSRAVGTLAAWKGPVTSDKAPFLGDQQPQLDESLRYTADFHLQDAYYMPTGIYSEKTNDSVPVEITKQLLMTVGPVSTNYYSHGLTSYNPNTYAVYNSVPRASDHAVLIVGWDDNFPKENFVSGNQPENDGAWLVRNSWGTDWGDDGYFWLSYEDKTLDCGNAYLLEEADNYANNYQYDTTGWSFSLATSAYNPTTGTAANIFTAEGDEQLEAVSFYTTDVGTRYHISVYTGVEEGQPTSGTCALSEQSGRENYAGYHTIELNQPVALEKGERFSIVVTFENPTYRMPIPIEWCPMPSSNYVPVHMGNGGESYVLSNDTWYDVAGSTHGNDYYITNVCIKGFTNPLPKSGSAISTVRFSEMEGPVAEGTQLSLSTDDGSDIYWSADGSSYQLYSGPIALDGLDSAGDQVTIRAYAEKEDQRGNTSSKTYTRAEAQLSDLAIKYGNKIQHFDVSQSAQSITLPIEAESVQVMGQSSDAITINGQNVASGEWSAPVALSIGETASINVSLSGSGKSDTTTLLNITRSTGSTPGVDDGPLFPILLDEKPDHGSLLMSPTQASKGSIVTLTVKPDNGYTLDDLTVTTENNRKIEIRAQGNGQYTFTMPDGAVSVNIHFAETTADSLPFDDVFTSDWFYDPVHYVYKHNLMVGTSDTRFEPQSNVTRAMIWAVLARQSGAEIDSTDGEWYSGVQKWAVANDITDGLRPNDSVSREELITMIHRYKSKPAASADLSAYSDAGTISEWATDAMTWGIETGLIAGLSDTTLGPRSGATRAQLATILMRFDKMA